MSVKLNRFLILTAGIITVFAGLIVLTGWAVDSYTLKTFGLGGVSMKVNTALSFLFLGIALIILQNKDRRINIILARIFSGFVALLGLLVLAQNVVGVNLGIDELLFHEVKDAVATVNPGQMAPNTSLNFIFLGIVLFFLSFKNMERSLVILFLFVSAFSISSLSLLGYASGFHELAGLAAFTKMAFNTSAVFIILSFGIYFIMYNSKINHTTIEYKLMTGLTVGFVLIIFGSIISMTSIRSLVSSSTMVKHTQVVKQELALVSSEVYELVSGDRAYLLTGNDRYLRQWYRSKENIPKLLNNLNELTLDNPRQQMALISLNQLMKERQDFSYLLVNTFKTKGRNAAITIFNTLKGKQINDDIGVIISKMNEEENRLLTERNAIEAENATNALIIILLNLFAQMVLMSIIFIFVKKDVSGRRKAEKDLKQLNEELEDRVKERTIELENEFQLNKSILESAGEGIYGLDLGGNATFVNQAAGDLLGYTIEELIGKDMHIIHHHHKADGSEYPRIECATNTVLNDGLTRTINDEVFWRKDGTPFQVEYTSAPVYSDGKLTGAVVVFKDVTERKKAEEENKKLNRIYTVLSNINQTIIRIGEKQKLYDEVCRILIEDGKFRMAWIGMLDTQINKIVPIASAGYTKDYLKDIIIDLTDEKLSQGPTGQAIKTGVHYLANDIANNSEMIPWREKALRYGYKSSASFPIFVFGKTVYTFTIYSDEQFFFNETEVKLLDELTMDISFAIEHLETEIKRKLSEEELHNSNERFNHLVSELNDVVWNTSIGGSGKVEVNGAFADLYGITLDQFAENPRLWIEMVHPDDRHLAEWSLKELHEKGKTEIEYRIIRPDGSVIWILDRKSMIYDKDGKPVQIGGIAKDITESKTALEKLKESENKYRNLVNEVNDGFYISNNQGILTFANNALAKILGFNVSEELIGHNFMEFIHPDAMDTILDKFQMDIENKNSLDSFEVKALKISGQTIFLELTTAPMLENDTVLGIRGVIRDVTERKIAEEALTYERNLLKAFMDNSTDNIYFKDRNSRFIRISKAQADSFGLSDPEQALGKTDFDFFTEEHARQAYKDEMRIMKTGQPIVGLEEKDTWPDGRVTWVSTTKIPLRDTKGEIVGTFGVSRDITERIKEHESLRENEERFHRTLDLGVVGMATTHPTTFYFLSANKCLCEMIGYTEEELLQKTWAEITFPKEKVDEDATNVKKLLSGELNGYVMEKQYQHKDGHMIDIILSVQGVRKSDDTIDYILILIEDITELKRNERMKQDQSEILESIIKKTPLPTILELIVKSVEKESPDSLCSILLIDEEGKHLHFCAAPSLPEFYNQAVDGFEIGETVGSCGAAAFLKKQVIVEDILTHPNWIPFRELATRANLRSCWSNPILDSENKVLGTLAIYHHEPQMPTNENFKIIKSVVELVSIAIINNKVEEEIRKVNTELEIRVEERTGQLAETNQNLQEEIEERKRTESQLIIQSSALNAAANAIVITNSKGKIEWVNPAFIELTGYSREEVIGKTPRKFKSGKQDVIFYKNLWDTILAGKVWHGELINKRKDGSEYFEEDIITPLKNENGTIIRFIAIKQDISNRKQAEEEIKKAKAEAEDANRMKSEFLANMSHEIRTPLNSIVGFSDILKDKLAGQHVYIEYLDNIMLSSKMLLNLINDILDLSKVEAGRMVAEYQPVNLYNVVNEIKAIFQTKATEKGLSFSINIHNEIPGSFITDERYLRQILFNLIGNAIKFTDEGHVDVDINIIPKDIEESKIDLRFIVKDSGIGIPSNQLNSIFEPFIQATKKDRNRYGGTGLGLSITKRLIELLGGTISVESQPDKGSVFIFSLFDIEIGSLQNEESGKAENKYLSGIRFKNPIILLTEDIRSNREVVKGYLESLNITIIEAENGEECLAAIRNQRPDLILMDIQMPVMDGFTAIEIIKTDKALKKIPIIALTASGMKQQKEHVRSIVDDYLIKPIFKDDLIAKLIKYLDYETTSETDKNQGEAVNEKSKVKNDKKLSSEIQEEMRNTFMPFITKLLIILNIDETKILIKKLEEYNKTKHIAEIEEFCNQLSGHIISFNIEKISMTLEQLSAFIKK